MPTPKQQKLIKLLLENLGKKGKTKTLGELVLEAGYEKSMSVNPYQILESKTVKEQLSDFQKQLQDKRRRALTHITDKKLQISPARDLAYITDTLNKIDQLLSGKPTDRIENVLSEEQANELLTRRSKKVIPAR